MLPTLANYDQANIRLADAEHAPKFGQWVDAGCVQSPHFDDIFFGQFGVVVLGAGLILNDEPETGPTSPFRVHVSRVVSSSSEKQVLRSAAMPHVTRMKDEHAFGNGAVGQFPSIAMSVDQLLLDENFPVTIGCTAVGPKPARISTFEGFPEHIGEWSHVKTIVRQCGISAVKE